MSSLIKSAILLGAVVLSFLCVAALGALLLDDPARLLLVWVGLAAAMLGAAPLAGGVLVLMRERQRQRGQPDMFWALTQRRREAALDRNDGFRSSRLRRALSHALQGHGFLPGDVVEVKSLPEILATLDDRGALDGMPFQPEMIRFCGQRVRVFRCLDKIYDYGRTRNMRRLSGCVLLSTLRCDGNAHAGCQAACYLVWKAEWLRHSTQPSVTSVVVTPVDSAPIPSIVAEGTFQNGVHRCQFTELHACSEEFGAQRWRKDLVPLLVGNYSLSAWLVAMLTRCFNDVQRRRGGLSFPTIPGVGAHLSPDTPRLSPGDRVVVRSVEEVAQTLNRSGKNRGLWFDPEMVKHCGREYLVDSRIERIIDDATGQMRLMKSPCITLRGVDASGEGLSFNAQHDPIFWRESWLKLVDDSR